VPARALLAVAGVVTVLMLADFSALVAANMALCCIKLLVQYMAFLQAFTSATASAPKVGDQ
jgi:hypothetical protein